MSGFTLELTAQPGAADLEVIGRGLTDFNTADVGPADRLALAVLVRNDAGTVTGGLSGYTGWGWLYVQWLWLDDSLRGLGLAAQMLDMAETEAQHRGCHGAYIDTFNPIALKVYQKQGYIPFGALADFPNGRVRTFLQKRLGPQ